MKLRSVVFLNGLLLAGLLTAAPSRLVLGEAEGENELTMEFTVSGLVKASDDLIYSGEILTDLEIDIETDSVVGFEMTGGQIEATDTSFLFSSFLFGSQLLELEDMRALPMSLEGKEVLEVPGQFDANQHVFEFNEGMAISSGDLENSTSDVASGPFFANGVTTGSVLLSNKEVFLSTLTGEVVSYSYDVDFSVVMDALSKFGSGLDALDVETIGTVTAAGKVEFGATDFFNWQMKHAPDVGLALAFDADANGDGVADGLTWALGFEAGIRVTQTLRIDPSEGSLEVLLGDAGVRSAVMIEKSVNLGVDSWEPVQELGVGTKGEVMISLNTNDVCFYRLSVSE